MNVVLYIDNLATSITEEELRTLFTQVGEAIASGINRDRRFPTAKALEQIDREVARFTASSLSSRTLRVRLKIPREQSGSSSQIFEP